MKFNLACNCRCGFMEVEFKAGSSSEDRFDGKTLSSHGDIIVISINYRLGVFGFLYTGDNRMKNGNLTIS